ncbi:MAG: S8 family serine peptidase [Candidatus Brocadiales bacterium]
MKEKYFNIIIAGAGVFIALIIGAAQVYIAIEQKRLADQQARIASLQGETQALSSWLPFLKDEDANVRLMAIIALERIGTQGVVAPLVIALSDTHESIRKRAGSALSRIATDDTVDIIVGILENQDPNTREAAINTLVSLGYERIPMLMTALGKAPPSVRPYVERAIGRILLNERVMKRIGALQSHELTMGRPKIVVALVGGGVDISLPDIRNALIDETNYTDDYGEPAISTALAARLIVGGVDSDIVGVAPGVKLISERVLGSGGGSSETVAEGVRHAARQGARIIYLELGSTFYNEELQKAINEAHSSGCIIVAAAGNSNSDTEEFPAAMDNVVAVAATDTDDKKATYSSFGVWVDITAPGNPVGENEFKNSELSVMKGTSFSGSLVAGAAALVWSIDPNFTNQQVEDILINTAKNIDDINPKYKKNLGSGRIDVLKAVNKALEIAKSSHSQ